MHVPRVLRWLRTHVCFVPLLPIVSNRPLSPPSRPLQGLLQSDPRLKSLLSHSKHPHHPRPEQPNTHTDKQAHSRDGRQGDKRSREARRGEKRRGEKRKEGKRGSWRRGCAITDGSRYGRGGTKQVAPSATLQGLHVRRPAQPSLIYLMHRLLLPSVCLAGWLAGRLVGWLAGVAPVLCLGWAQLQSARPSRLSHLFASEREKVAGCIIIAITMTITATTTAPLLLPKRAPDAASSSSTNPNLKLSSCSHWRPRQQTNTMPPD